jgi:DnaJ-class molecular chaperone
MASEFSFSSYYNEEIIEKKTEDIYYNINVKLEDIYMKKIKKISLIHKRNIDGNYIDKKIDYKIPVYMKETIFFEEAHDKRGYNKRGDIIITIIDKEHSKFKRINEIDLITTHEINLYDIYKGFSFKIKHLDGEIINIKSRPESFIQQGHFYQKIDGKGLPNENQRGDLFIRYIINFPFIENIEMIVDGHNYDNDNYDENIYIESKNCAYEEIYKLENENN